MYIKLNKYIEEFGNIKGFFIFIYVIIYRLITKVVIYCLNRTIEIDDRTLVFISDPTYSDNSRALSDYLVDNGYSEYYKIYWCVEDAKLQKMKHPKDGVIFLDHMTKYHIEKLSSLIIFFRAKFILATHAFPLSLEQRREGQRFIRLWHGSSFKGKSENDGIWEKDKYGDFGFILVAGPIFVKAKATFFNVSEKYICPLGFPRYDWLLSKKEKAIKLKKTFTPKCEKLIIWMPTFRNHSKGKFGSIKELTGFPLLKKNGDWMKLDQICQECKIIIVVKLHMFQIDYGIGFKQFQNIKLISNETFEDAGVNMYEFLAVTDALITDYSSVGIDYLIVNKPIAFTLEDYDIYKKNRGFIIENPKDYMPGNHIYNLDDLCIFIKDVSEGKDLYYNKRITISEQLIHLSSNYCKEITKNIGLRKPE